MRKNAICICDKPTDVTVLRSKRKGVPIGYCNICKGWMIKIIPIPKKTGWFKKVVDIVKQKWYNGIQRIGGYNGRRTGFQTHH